MPSPSFTADLLRRSARGYAAATLARIDRDGGAILHALPETFAAPVDDLEVRVRHLAEAVAVGLPELFEDAVRWYRVAFAHRGVADPYLGGTLAALGSVLAEELPAPCRPHVGPHLARGAAAAAAAPAVPASPIEQDAPGIDVARRFLLAALEGRGEDALDLIRAQLDAGAGVAHLQDRVLIPVQHEIGRMWLLAETPIADEHLLSQLVLRSLDLLQERVPRAAPDAPHVLAFAVGGNRHDLGIRVIAQRLQLAGFRVTCLGGDMPVSDLAWAMSGRRYDLLAVSATMLLQLGGVAAVAAERDRALGGRPPLLVGGRPFEVAPDLWSRIGADAAAADGASAVAAAVQLTGRQPGGN